MHDHAQPTVALTLPGTSTSTGSPLDGGLALVTGASRGIGEAVARALAREGSHVVLVSRTVDRLEALAGELGGTALPLDLTDRSATAEATAGLIARRGVPDVMVNAAGVFDIAPIHETTADTFDRNLDVNLRSAFWLLRCLLPAMLERGSGLVVNIGSVAGRQAFPGNAAYSASKYGLRGLHEVLVEEVRGTGVRACLIEPSATDTTIWDPMDPDNHPALPSRDAMLAPDDVAEAVLFVCTRPRTVQIPLVQIARA